MVEMKVRLSEEDAQKLQAQASRMGVQPEELAGTLVVDGLSHLSEDFKVLVKKTLEEDAELLRRLA